MRQHHAYFNNNFYQSQSTNVHTHAGARIRSKTNLKIEVQIHDAKRTDMPCSDTRHSRTWQTTIRRVIGRYGGGGGNNKAMTCQSIENQHYQITDEAVSEQVWWLTLNGYGAVASYPFPRKWYGKISFDEYSIRFEYIFTSKVVLTQLMSVFDQLQVITTFKHNNELSIANATEAMSITRLCGATFIHCRLPLSLSSSLAAVLFPPLFTSVICG